MDPPLAGMQKQAPFLPGIDFEKFQPGAVPTYEDIVEGRDLVKFDKVPVKVKGYSVKVFDMLTDEGRDGYSSLMKDLTEGVQTSRYAIFRNDLQVLQRGGDSQWYRYVEWAEYELNDPILKRRSGSKDSNDVVVGAKGAFQEIG